MADDLSLAAKLAEMAAETIASLSDTDYVHQAQDPDEAAQGIFFTDCSGYVAYLLSQVAAKHLAMIPKDPSAKPAETRLLAHDFYAFAQRLPSHAQNGWRRIARVDDLVAGDIVAWKLQGGHHKDTGHVFVVAGEPVPASAGDAFLVPSYDSSEVPHFDDSRGPDETGVGTGRIRLGVDGDGAPSTIQFHSGGAVDAPPIAIARLEPFSASD